MTCVQCNGWGWVLQLKRDPGQYSIDYRTAVQKRIVNGRAPELPLGVALCTNCGGYGSRQEEG